MLYRANMYSVETCEYKKNYQNTFITDALV